MACFPEECEFRKLSFILRKKEKLFNYRPNDDSDSRKLLFSAPLLEVVLQVCLQVLPKTACIIPFV